MLSISIVFNSVIIVNVVWLLIIVWYINLVLDKLREVKGWVIILISEICFNNWDLFFVFVLLGSLVCNWYKEGYCVELYNLKENKKGFCFVF